MPVATAAPIVIRPLRDSDEAQLRALFESLSMADCYRRWFSGGVNLREMIRAAAHPTAQTVAVVACAGEEIVGHAILACTPEGEGEVAFEVAPAWRHHGIAGGLLAHLVGVARERGLDVVTADVLAENVDMLAVLREHGGFVATREGSTTHLRLELT